MNFDRLLTLEGAGARVVLTSPDGHTLKYAVQLDSRATNIMPNTRVSLPGCEPPLGWGSAACSCRATPSLS